MSEHTPGPWEVRDGLVFAANEPQIGPIAHAILPYRIDERGVCTAEAMAPEREANTRLIAAAPDLLEACEQMVKDVERAAQNNVIWPATLRQARNAVAKAKDQTQ